MAKTLAPYDLVPKVGSVSERLSDECKLQVCVYGTIRDLRWGGARSYRSKLRP